jgi:hypothetical protein
VVGLAGLLVFGFLAGFFAWVSAEPLWLDLGHGSRGSATVTRCTGRGMERRCVGTFVAARGAFHREQVALLALPVAARRPGAIAVARMVSPKARAAYAGARGELHLRWVLGVALVVGCGGGIAWSTGASRLPRRRAAGYATSLAGPLVLLIGMLVVTW